ncbi:hypothetical protein IJX73_00960 [bacterium]|nr:hypothetical protein [bacterium]
MRTKEMNIDKLKKNFKTELEILLIKTRYLEASFNLKNAIKNLIKATKTGTSKEIIDWAFIVASLKDKYFKAKQMLKQI